LEQNGPISVSTVAKTCKKGLDLEAKCLYFYEQSVGFSPDKPIEFNSL